MSQHGSRHFAHRPHPPPPTPGMGSIGNNLSFSRHVHVKLNGVTNVARWLQIFCPHAPPLDHMGQKVKIQLFQNNVMLHIKLKGIRNAATWSQIFCLLTSPYDIPLLTLRVGSIGLNSTISEHGHVA